MRDRDVRSAVKNMLAGQYGGDATTRIVEEMGIWSGSVRIDIAVINGTLSGFELKSDRDTLDRLPAQVELYNKVFDHLVLVAGEKHAPRALDWIPDWWGITIASAGASVCLAEVRPARPNPAPDARMVAKLLWKEEALQILDTRGLARGWRSRSASAIHDRLAEALSFPELAAAVRQSLKSRGGWLGKPIADQGKVPVDTDLDPLSSTA